MIEQIYDNEILLAIIIRAEYESEGIEFFTPHDFSQQLAYMNRPAGYSIEPHVHNLIPRKVHYTQETLIIKKGKLRVDFYSQDKTYIDHRTLKTGDVILLASGGHGFTMLEETEIIEVKQGPYRGEKDKSRFKGISLPSNGDES